MVHIHAISQQITRYGHTGTIGGLAQNRQGMEDVMHVIGLVIIFLGIAATAWFWQSQQRTDNLPIRIEQSTSHSRSLELLNERYARGDISREEYLEKKRDLEK